MSAEGKKKRGLSGQSNAKNIPFRYGGSKCDFNTSYRHPNHPMGAGSKLVQAMNIGIHLENFNPSERLIKMTDAAMTRCTHPMLT